MQKEIIKQLEKEIKEGYGKKCKDYNPFCVNCIMWKALETIKEGLDYSKPEKKIDILQLYGYKKWLDER